MKWIPRYFFIASIVLFAISLTQSTFCTRECGYLPGIWVLLIGWLGLGDGAAISWLANPLLFWSWIAFMFKDSKNYFIILSLILSILAFLASVSFLGFDKIVDNEGGVAVPILHRHIGYWLWLTSTAAMVVGNGIRVWSKAACNQAG